METLDTGRYGPLLTQSRVLGTQVWRSWDGRCQVSWPDGSFLSLANVCIDR
jgi:hypothetical protein